MIYIDSVVILRDGRKGLIESGAYYGDSGGVSNYWSGRVLDDQGNVTDEEFKGYNNGHYWIEYSGDYVVNKSVNFK